MKQKSKLELLERCSNGEGMHAEHQKILVSLATAEALIDIRDLLAEISAKMKDSRIKYRHTI